VPARDLAVLAEMVHVEHLPENELLFQHGDPADCVYVVAAGRLAVFLPDAPKPVRHLEPGDVLGEYGMFAGMTRTATVRAETAAVLLSLDYQRFRAFLLHFPEATLVLLKTAVQRLVEHERKT
jgi:CRP-like cAMP-binding protein